MKVAIILLILAASAYATMVLDQQMINEINARDGWRAGFNDRFDGVDVQTVKKMLGLEFPHDMDHIPVMHYEDAGEELPDEFDSRTQWPTCVHPVQNQAQCGSCWAFGATETLGDRFCIATGDATPQLSAQDAVSCDTADSGCGGGYLDKVWEYLVNTGVVDAKCMPYTAGGGSVDKCPSKCTGSGVWKKYKAASYHTFTTAEDIMEEIYTNGPVDTGFMVYQDFMSYQSGVYYHQTGPLMGGHSVEIVGWGHDNSTGLDYWIVKNSWGTGWGIDGYFWIKKGDNECEIEQNVIAGLPSTKNLKKKAMVLDENIIATANQDNDLWTAGINKRFIGVTLAEAKKLLGARPRPTWARPAVLTGKVPDSFDWTNQKPECVHAIRNQAQCGSCWAFGCAESISDRFCIDSKGDVDVILSPQTLVSCDHTDQGCNGGMLQNAWEFAADNGLATDECMPYESGSGSVPSCPSKCKNGSKPIFYKVDESSIQTYSDENSIMNEVYKNGPAEVSFAVYQDFFGYTKGIYTHKTGPLEGYHAVKVVGWGEQDGTKFWRIANSWGADWGMDGYFLIKRGVDECMIEENCVGGKPILP